MKVPFSDFPEYIPQAVLRIKVVGLLVLLQRRRPIPFFFEHATEVVMVIGIPGVDLDRFFKMNLRLVQVCSPQINQAELMVRVGVLWIDSQAVKMCLEILLSRLQLEIAAKALPGHVPQRNHNEEGQSEQEPRQNKKQRQCKPGQNKNSGRGEC